MSFYEDIKALAARREKIKAELFEALAQRKSNQERWIIYKEPTPLEERVALDAKIACLQSDRQSSKMKLKEMRATVAANKDHLYRQSVKEVLSEYGLDDVSALIRERFETKLRQESGEV